MYAATREQLLLLSKKAQSEYSSYYPPAFSVFLTCLINCIMSLNDIERKVFIDNAIIGSVSLIVGIIFFAIAKHEQRDNKSLLNDVLSQPIQVAADNKETEINDWTKKS